MSQIFNTSDKTHVSIPDTDSIPLDIKSNCNGGIFVENTFSVLFGGDGSTCTPLFANVAISAISGNTLSLLSDGLFVSGGTGTGKPAGLNTQIQYNNNGAFGASSGLTWDGSEFGVNFDNNGHFFSASAFQLAYQTAGSEEGCHLVVGNGDVSIQDGSGSRFSMSEGSVEISNNAGFMGLEVGDAFIGVNGEVYLDLFPDKFQFTGAPILATDLAGTGNRMVIADASGVLGTQAITIPSLQNVMDIGNTTTDTIVFDMPVGGRYDFLHVINPFPSPEPGVNYEMAILPTSNGDGTYDMVGVQGWNIDSNTNHTQPSWTTRMEYQYTGDFYEYHLQWASADQARVLRLMSYTLQDHAGTNDECLLFFKSTGTEFRPLISDQSYFSFGNNVGAGSDTTIITRANAAGTIVIRDVIDTFSVVTTELQVGATPYNWSNFAGYNWTFASGVHALNIQEVPSPAPNVGIQLTASNFTEYLTLWNPIISGAGDNAALIFSPASAGGANNAQINLSRGSGAMTYQVPNGGYFHDFLVSGSPVLTMTGSAFTIPLLAGSGTRMVVADGSGDLSTQAIPVASVTSVSNSDGTLTITPTSGAVVASLALGHANTWTAAQTFLLTSLGATPTSNVLLRNTTAATVSLNQISPSILWEGQGWKTAATAGSQPVQYRMYASPTTGVSQPLQNFGLTYSVNASAFQSAFNITYDGSGQVFRVFQHADGTGQYSAVYLTNSGGTQTGGMLGVNQSGEVRFGGFNGGGYFMTLYANNVERARIVASTGNLIINTTTDDTINKLQVNGTVKSTQYRISALNTAPASSTDTGALGEIRITAGFIYVCTATNTWVRTALATF